MPRLQKLATFESAESAEESPAQKVRKQMPKIQALRALRVEDTNDRTQQVLNRIQPLALISSLDSRKPSRSSTPPRKSRRINAPVANNQQSTTPLQRLRSYTPIAEAPRSTTPAMFLERSTTPVMLVQNTTPAISVSVAVSNSSEWDSKSYITVKWYKLGTIISTEIKLPSRVNFNNLEILSVQLKEAINATLKNISNAPTVSDQIVKNALTNLNMEYSSLKNTTDNFLDFSNI